MPHPSSVPCPSDDELVGLVEGGLDGAALGRLKEHVAGCRICAGVVAGLGLAEADFRWARDAVAEESEGMRGGLFAGPVLVRVGARIADRFVVSSHAGSGGMGTVYRALDEQTGGTVALKLLQQGAGPTVAERFAREVRVLSELSHPSIVAYLAHGETETGAPYLAMEWLEGEDLARRLARGPLPIAEAIVLLRSAAEALAVAHARGLVHRDLKPSNLFLRGGQVERVALLDFGIARRDAASQAVTGTGAIVGTPGYMAPEQVRGEQPLGAAADVFSLGCVMFECITGERPFQAKDLAATLARVLFEEPPRLSQVCPGAPPVVEALLARMLAKSAGTRFKDASALVAALDALGPMAKISPPAASGEQRLLSVLMATTSLDAGDLHELEGHGAEVEVLADGSLVAMLVHTGSAATDQAARAAQFAMRIKARWPEARVALSTGSGLLHERVMAGEAFDRAAALLRDHAGGPGSDRILIDEATRGLLEVRFVTERMPSGVYVLTGDELSLDATRPLLGKPTPCVGREAELAMLEASFSGCVEEAEPRAVVVKAPPGVGKSRLRHEFLRRISAKGDAVSIVVGRGDPLSTGTSYGLFGQALRRMAGLLDAESVEVRREKLARRIGERLPEEARSRVVAFLGELSGVPFPDEHDMRLRAARQNPLLMSDQSTLAALDFLRAECAASPLLLVLEDLHWGDALTVKLCGTALRELSGCPLMVLALARPEVEELFAEAWSGAESMRLRPLSKGAGERLVRQALGEQASPETVTRIVAQSEGNALFLEELIRAVAEGKDDEPSATVLALMQARIGRVPASARRVLRAASVFGEIAGSGGIRALLGGSMGHQEIDGWLTVLVREEILEERSEHRHPGEKVYRFRHALVRDAAYSLSSEEERVAWHLLAGEHLLARGEPDSLVLAEHFLRGGEPLRAAPHYLRAGEESYEANDMVGTSSSAQCGLGCGAEGELRGALLSLEVSACMWQEQLDEVISLGIEAIELLVPGTRPWCRSFRNLCAAATFTDRTALLAELAPRFAHIEPSADAIGEYVQGASWFANMLAVASTPGASRAFRDRARQVSAAAGRDDLLVWGYLHVMEGIDAYLIEEAPWSSMTRVREARDMFQAVGEQRYQQVARALLGKALHELGDPTGAEAVLRDSLAQSERIGAAVSQVYVRVYLARLLAQTAPIDRLDEPEALARDVMAAKNTSLAGPAHGVLAEIRRRRGDLVDAEREARAGCEAARTFPSYAWGTIALLARILIERGRAEEALAAAEAGVQELERLGFEGNGEIDLRLSLADALHAVGRVEAARAALAGAIPRLKKRLEDIPEPAARARYLTNVRANARMVALAEAWLGEEAVRALGP